MDHLHRHDFNVTRFLLRQRRDPLHVIAGRIRAIWSSLRTEERKMFVGKQPIILHYSTEAMDDVRKMFSEVDLVVSLAASMQGLIFDQTGVMFTQWYLRRLIKKNAKAKR